MRIEKDRIFKVETRAFLEGLQITWEFGGYRYLELKCDNAMVVELILTGDVAVNKMIKLQSIDQVLKRYWSVQIRIFLEITIKLLTTWH